MATITRGYSFSPTEQVNSEKLRQLIVLANISGISWSEFNGTVVGISPYSAPANAPAGWVSAEYEPMDSAAQSNFSATHSELQYFIQTPNNKALLFGCHGRFETRRFIMQTGTQSPYGTGRAVFPGTGTNSVTLTLGFQTGNNAYGNPQCFGVLAMTGVTSPTNSDGFPRVLMRGPGYVFNDSPAAAVAIPHYIFSDAHGDGGLGVTCSTDMDKMIGVSQEGAGGTSLKFGILCSPVWRA